MGFHIYLVMFTVRGFRPSFMLKFFLGAEEIGDRTEPIILARKQPIISYEHLAELQKLGQDTFGIFTEGGDVEYTPRVELLSANWLGYHEVPKPPD